VAAGDGEAGVYYCWHSGYSSSSLPKAKTISTVSGRQGKISGKGGKSAGGNQLKSFRQRVV